MEKAFSDMEAKQINSVMRKSTPPVTKQDFKIMANRMTSLELAVDELKLLIEQLIKKNAEPSATGGKNAKQSRTTKATT